MSSSTDQNEQILTAALSAILGKEILPESCVPAQSQKYISKVSIFNQHLASFIYGKVGSSNEKSNDLHITIHIKILANKTMFPCLIERDASVDKLKRIIYEREGILCNKQNLIYCGQEIDEGHLLSEYNVDDGSEITVVRLRAMNDDDILVLDKDSWDRMYDYDFTNIDDEGKHFIRGGIEYRRPCGWKRFAIKVIGKYENEAWLGSNNSPDEWPVSYHGLELKGAQAVAKMGYDLTKHKRFVHGRGVYSTPDINVAKGFAKTFTANGEEYFVILQNRVNPNPENLIKLSNEETGNGEYWISPSDTDIRPYGLCIKRKQKLDIQ